MEAFDVFLISIVKTYSPLQGRMLRMTGVLLLCPAAWSSANFLYILIMYLGGGEWDLGPSGSRSDNSEPTLHYIARSLQAPEMNNKLCET